MSAFNQLTQVNLLILNGELGEAEKVLRAVKPKTVAEKRSHAHHWAMLEFHRGQVAEARARLEQARADFNDNVNLLRDLAVFLYHQHDMLAFRQTLDLLERTLAEEEPKLSPRSLFECELMLGKFLEEEARLAPAMIYYEKALLRATNNSQRLRVLLQKARWLAHYEPTEELSALYRELISVPTDQVTKDLGIEFEHSLLLIELRLIGADHAWERFNRLSQNVDEIDRRLLLFDFIEGALAQDHPLSPSVLETVQEFKNLDPFENYLKLLVQASLEPAEKIQELNRLATRVSWASYLRALCLTANFEQVNSVKQELNRKIQLLIRSLDIKSQTLWNSRLKQALQAPEIRVDFSVRARSITIQGKVVDLSKKKISQQLLAVLLKQPALTVDQAIEHLWQSSFTPEHYHRLRMGVHRLNSLVNECSGQGKIIEVDSQEVRLRPEVKLRAADDLLENHLSLN